MLEVLGSGISLRYEEISRGNVWKKIIIGFVEEISRKR